MSTTCVQPQVSRLRRRLADHAGAYAFLLPNLLGFLVFTLVPIGAVSLLAFTQWDIINPPQWVGLRNFSLLLGGSHVGGRLAANDPDFWRFLWNTVYLMAGLPLAVAGALLLALLLNQRLRGVVAFRTIFFLPAICSPVAVALLWKWIYAPDFGLLNWLLQSVGVAHPPAWLQSTAWSKPAFILMGLWTAVGGYNCVLYLAGLQGIPGELYEAADMDGATGWQKLRHITWPLLSPTTFFIVVMGVISGFQGGFTAAYLMTDGGPAGSTTTIMYYIYLRAFQGFEMGYAAAIALVLFVLVFGFTLINWQLGKRVVHYQ